MTAGIACAVTLLAPRVASAQSATALPGAMGGLDVGGELENYLRYLQTMGKVGAMPWSLRAFSPRQADSLMKVAGAHPWQHSWLFAQRTGNPHFAVLPLEVATRFNSAYPFGGNDGPIWAGRGLTPSIQGGVAAYFGPLTIVLRPMAFVAQNEAFKLVPTGVGGNGQYLNPDYSVLVDLPQRFGSGSYARFDPGESIIRLDVGALGLGFTTADEWWGPATTYPVILGNNAAGIPHAFVGTNRPVNIGIGKVQVQVLYGLEQQSPYSPVSGSTTFADLAHPGTERFMSGLIGTFSPGAVPGLELGAARFFHQAWFGHVGSAELKSPFEGILKSSIGAGYTVSGAGNQDALKNQLASLFARWVLPRSGFELYGEYGHEDHNADLRDLESEPDHSRIAMVGFRKAFALSQDGTRFSALRAEYIDGTAPSLLRHRGEGGIYVHTVLTQGHTQDGQLLGANIGVGSPAAAVLALDRYSPRGRSTWSLTKVAQDNAQSYYTTGVQTSFTSQTLGTLGYQTVRFGRRADLMVGVSATLRRGLEYVNLGNRLNIGFSAGVSLHPAAVGADARDTRAR